MARPAPATGRVLRPRFGIFSRARPPFCLGRFPWITASSHPPERQRSVRSSLIWPSCPSGPARLRRKRRHHRHRRQRRRERVRWRDRLRRRARNRRQPRLRRLSRDGWLDRLAAGRVGSGGSPATGGNPGTGGTPATGGSPGTGGSTIGQRRGRRRHLPDGRLQVRAADPHRLPARLSLRQHVPLPKFDLDRELGQCDSHQQHDQRRRYDQHGLVRPEDSDRASVAATRFGRCGSGSARSTERTQPAAGCARRSKECSPTTWLRR